MRRAVRDLAPVAERYLFVSTGKVVLKLIYKTAKAGQTAAGIVGFTPTVSKLRDIDVSDLVRTHFEYRDALHFRTA